MAKKEAFMDRELLRQIPKVLRARDFHLYIEGGKRLVDLWLQGGRAILGHKPPRFLAELKNAAERGLFSTLPHPMERRLIKALGEFFPGRAFRLYNDEGALYGALGEAGRAGPFTDPAFPRAGLQQSEKTGALFWRPFMEDPPEAAILIPVLPWPLGPSVLVLEKEMEASFPAGELVPPVLLAPAARALYDLTRALKDPGSKRSVKSFPKIEKALGQPPGGSIWRTRGIYLTVEPEMDGEKYGIMFMHFLDGGFLIPPSQGEPLILPAAMSSGEESKLAELLRLKPEL